MHDRVCRMNWQANRWRMPKDFGCTNLLRDLQLMLRVFVKRLEIVTSLLQGRLFLEQCETVLRRLYLFSGRQIELAWQSLDLGPQLLDPDPVVDGGGHCCLRRLRDSDNDDGDDDDGDTLLCAPRCRYSSCFPSSSSSSPSSATATTTVASYTASSSTSLSRLERMDAGCDRTIQVRTHPSPNRRSWARRASLRG